MANIFAAADMKECLITAEFNENDKPYFTLTTDRYAFPSLPALGMVKCIIENYLILGNKKFQNEEIDQIISRLNKLKRDY